MNKSMFNSVSGGYLSTPSASSSNLFASVGGEAKWSPSPADKPYYDFLFNEADTYKTQKIGGKEAVAFFTRSNLPVTTLREIWVMCENKAHNYLDKESFTLACRLIALAQENIPPAPGIAEATATKVVLPKFQGIPLPSTPAPDPWAMTIDDRAKYANIFKTHDTNRDGYLTGQEAAEFFSRSGAKTDDLRTIWSLSDIDKDGKLDLKEFTIAMHLTVRVVKLGLPVPETLPTSIAAEMGVLPDVVSVSPLPTPTKSGNDSKRNLFDSKRGAGDIGSNELETVSYKSNIPPAPESDLLLPTSAPIQPQPVTTDSNRALERDKEMDRAVTGMKDAVAAVKSTAADYGQVRGRDLQRKLIDQVESLKFEISEVDEQIKQSSAAFKAEIAAAEELVIEVEELQTKLAELRAKRDLQVELLNDERARRLEAGGKKGSILVEIELLEKQLQELQEARDAVKDEIHDVSMERMTKQVAIHDLTSAKTGHLRGIEDNQNDIAIAERILASKRSAVDRLKKENKDLQNKLKSEKEFLLKTHKEFDSINGEVEGLASAHEASSLRKADMKKQVEDLAFGNQSNDHVQDVGFEAFTPSEGDNGFFQSPAVDAFGAVPFEAFGTGSELPGESYDAFAFGSSTTGFDSSDTGFDAFGTAPVDNVSWGFDDATGK